MLFNVPQFIDVEDKVAGPLTGKQVLWLIGMGAVLFILWTFLDTLTFFVAAVPTVILFAFFAFYRPYNQSLLTFSIHGFAFLFRPKVYTWDRSGIGPREAVDQTVKKLPSNEDGETKRLSIGEIQELAGIVDRRRN